MISSFHDWIRTVAIALLAVGAIIFLYETSKQLDSLVQTSRQTLQTANDLLAQSTAIEEKTSDAVDRFAVDAVKREADWQKAQLQFYKTITDAKEILVRTDHSLNDVLVPRMAASLDASTALQNTAAASIVTTTAKIDDTIDGLRPLIDNGIRATAAAATAMADPSIHETLAHVDSVSSNAEATSADLRKIADAWAAPVKGTWNHIKVFLREIAGPAAEVATALK